MSQSFMAQTRRKYLSLLQFRYSCKDSGRALLECPRLSASRPMLRHVSRLIIVLKSSSRQLSATLEAWNVEVPLGPAGYPPARPEAADWTLPPVYMRPRLERGLVVARGARAGGALHHRQLPARPCLVHAHRDPGGLRHSRSVSLHPAAPGPPHRRGLAAPALRARALLHLVRGAAWARWPASTSPARR